MEREPKLAVAILDWYQKINAKVKSSYLPADSDARKDLLAKLAGLTTLVGPLDSEEAKNFFFVICLLFLNKKRTGRWESAVELFPADRDRLIAFTELIRGYEKLAASGEAHSLSKAKINLAQTVKYGFKMSESPDAFLDAIRQSWRTWPSQLFSEILLREAERSHRGSFGDFSEQNYYSELDGIEEV